MPIQLEWTLSRIQNEYCHVRSEVSAVYCYLNPPLPQAVTEEAVQIIIQSDLYIDNVTTEANIEKEACVLQQKFITTFEKGQFELHNCANNSARFLETIQAWTRARVYLSINKITQSHSMNIIQIIQKYSRLLKL